MRVLVCGGRDFSDLRLLSFILSEFRPKSAAFGAKDVGAVPSEHVFILGGAPGADRLAEKWADAWGIRKEVYPADWDRSGRSAGPIRNARMITEGKPDLVIAFPRANGEWGKGTMDCVRRAEAAGIPVRRIEWASAPGKDQP